MNMRNALILGGYGNTGRALAGLLLRETKLNLVLAGRSLDRAEETAAALCAKYDCDRISACRADASDPASLWEAFMGMDLVVVCSSTAQHAHGVATAALEAGVHYLDVQYSTQKVGQLQSLQREMEDGGLIFITEGGFHPGLPAALIRCAADQFDRLDRADVGSVIQIDWEDLDLSPATVDEFLGELLDFQSLVYRDGEWRKPSGLTLMFPGTMDFGLEFGRRACIPMFLEEMRFIPELFPEIGQTGFYVGGFNAFVDWVLSPVLMLMLRASPVRSRPLASRSLEWGLKRFSSPPFGTLLKLEARGFKNGAPKAVDLTVCHADGYFMTAAPVAACLLQLLDGTIQEPGLHLQALAVEPERFLRDMERMGIEVRLEVMNGRPARSSRQSTGSSRHLIDST